MSVLPPRKPSQDPRPTTGSSSTLKVCRALIWLDIENSKVSRQPVSIGAFHIYARIDIWCPVQTPDIGESVE